jgi:hypothetical protein
MIALLGKVPKFIPKARSLSMTEVLGACAKLNYRMVRAFEHIVRLDDHKRRDAIRRDAGVQSWTPKQRSLTMELCRTYVQQFFKCADENGAWRGNQFLTPYFDRRIYTMERDVVAAATNATKTLTARHRWPNVSKAEQSVITRMQERDVGYHTADMNYGAVVHSKNLFKEQCILHLEDGKGTYCKTVDQTKEDILEEVFSRLCMILIPFKKQGMEWAQVAESILHVSSMAVKGGRLC